MPPASGVAPDRRRARPKHRRRPPRREHPTHRKRPPTSGSCEGCPDRPSNEPVVRSNRAQAWVQARLAVLRPLPRWPTQLFRSTKKATRHRSPCLCSRRLPTHPKRAPARPTNPPVCSAACPPLKSSTDSSTSGARRPCHPARRTRDMNTRQCTSWLPTGYPPHCPTPTPLSPPSLDDALRPQERAPTACLGRPAEFVRTQRRRVATHRAAQMPNPMARERCADDALRPEALAAYTHKRCGAPPTGADLA